jgi:hypothetical protein
VVRRGDYVVEPIPLGMGRELVAAHHYSRGSSNSAVYRHGLFRPENPMDCLGVAIWLMPTAVAAKSVDPENWARVLTLSRLVVEPGMPTNAASFLLAGSIRLIRRDRKWVALVTYADEGQGHTGAIYRATNWEYVGANSGDPVYVDARGRQFSRLRGGTGGERKSFNHAEMLERGLTRLPATRKHKFVMRLA